MYRVQTTSMSGDYSFLDLLHIPINNSCTTVKIQRRHGKQRIVIHMKQTQSEEILSTNDMLMPDKDAYSRSAI